MQPGTAALVLVAAACHAVWNTASKYKRGDTVLFVWAYAIASAALFLPLGAVSVATGAQRLDWRLAAGCAVSAALHLTYSLTLQTGYDRAELGVVYPVARGTGPVLTMLGALLVLGEHITGTAAAGAGLVVGGILVVTGNPFGHRNPLPGIAWGAATGATIVAYTLWDSDSITALHLDPVAYYVGTMLLQTLILLPRGLARRRELAAEVRTDVVPILVIAVLSPVAYILVLVAMRSAPVALVAPLRESSIVLGSLLAWRLFDEGGLPRRLAGAVIVLAGIAAISL
ncbi:DMT family transporter [Actinacidiphila guanduensis]|uniref:EamA-like transporter family protein n=1 Tax=Actinacidiphila guanduensis TaxID=310781 RepID=A0A1H0B7N4_9ACTN|nr:DMT family transporter [Actinacidiphila guanduensis]SDN41611.1 EamA-like transporter family protein [Actinacidiphila guanduensis]